MRLGVERISRPPGARRATRLCDERLRVGDMLDHFHRGDEVKLAVERFDPDRAIVDGEPLRRGMGPRGGDQFGRGVDRGDRWRRAGASGSASRPAPQPTSSAVLPASGLRRMLVEVEMLVDHVADVAQAAPGSTCGASPRRRRGPTSRRPWRRSARLRSGRMLVLAHARDRNRARALPATRKTPPLMPRIVMKFGGTSMAGIERIRSVAARVKREAEAGNEVLVVVSAMAGETDRLIQLCKEAAALHDPKEYDVVVAQRRAGHRRAAGDDAAEHGGQGAQLHGLAIAPRHRGPRQCPGRHGRGGDAQRGAVERRRSRSSRGSRG